MVPQVVLATTLGKCYDRYHYWSLLEVQMKDAPLTMSVPAAGKKYYGLSKNGSYAAAHRGEIPTIRIGKLLRVPVRRLEKKLDGDA